MPTPCSANLRSALGAVGFHGVIDEVGSSRMKSLPGQTRFCNPTIADWQAIMCDFTRWRHRDPNAPMRRPPAHRFPSMIPKRFVAGDRRRYARDAHGNEPVPEKRYASGPLCVWHCRTRPGVHRRGSRRCPAVNPTNLHQRTLASAVLPPPCTSPVRTPTRHQKSA